MLVTLTLVSTHISLFRTDGVRTSQQCVCIYAAVYSQTLTAISIFKYVNIVCIIQVHKASRPQSEFCCIIPYLLFDLRSNRSKPWPPPATCARTATDQHAAPNVVSARALALLEQHRLCQRPELRPSQCNAADVSSVDVGSVPRPASDGRVEHHQSDDVAAAMAAALRLIELTLAAVPPPPPTGPESPGGGLQLQGSWGWSFLLGVGFLFVLYCLAGCCRASSHGRSGVAALPHADFWRSLPELVGDGVRFAMGEEPEGPTERRGSRTIAGLGQDDEYYAQDNGQEYVPIGGGSVRTTRSPAATGCCNASPPSCHLTNPHCWSFAAAHAGRLRWQEPVTGRGESRRPQRAAGQPRLERARRAAPAAKLARRGGPETASRRRRRRRRRRRGGRVAEPKDQGHTAGGAGRAGAESCRVGEFRRLGCAMDAQCRGSG